MSRRLKEIRETNPDLANDPKILEVDQDIESYAAIAALADSEGGKELRKAMRSDIVAAINTFIRGYSTLPLTEMQAIGAKIEQRVDMLLALGNARQNREDAEKTLDELTS